MPSASTAAVSFGKKVLAKRGRGRQRCIPFFAVNFFATLLIRELLHHPQSFSADMVFNAFSIHRRGRIADAKRFQEPQHDLVTLL